MGIKIQNFLPLMRGGHAPQKLTIGVAHEVENTEFPFFQLKETMKHGGNQRKLKVFENHNGPCQNTESIWSKLIQR